MRRTLRRVAAALALGAAATVATPAHAVNYVRVTYPDLPEASDPVGPVKIVVRDMRLGDGVRPLPRAASASDLRPRLIGWRWPEVATARHVNSDEEFEFRLRRRSVSDVVGETVLRGLRAGGIHARTVGAGSARVLRVDVLEFWCSSLESAKGTCSVRLLLAAGRWEGRIEAREGALFRDLAEDRMLSAALETVAEQARDLAVVLRPGLPRIVRAEPRVHPRALVLVDRETGRALPRADAVPEDDAGRLDVVFASRPGEPLSQTRFLSLLDEPVLSDRFWGLWSIHRAARPTEGGDERVAVGWGLASGAITAAALIPVTASVSVDWCWEGSCGPPPLAFTAVAIGIFAASGIPLIVDGSVRQKNARKMPPEPQVPLENLVFVPRLWEAVEAYNASLD